MLLLIDIHKVNEELVIYFNAGKLTMNKIGTLPEYGLVWYAEDETANILSFANMFRSISSNLSNHHVERCDCGKCPVFGNRVLNNWYFGSRPEKASVSETNKPQ